MSGEWSLDPPSEERSRTMRAVPRTDTAPEMMVRRALHALGLRFRLYRRDLPGSPDIVLPRHRAVIFVHGCFWHRHLGCRRASMPKTRESLWRAKFDRTVQRDARVDQELRSRGWKVHVVWECECSSVDVVSARLSSIFRKQTGVSARCELGPPRRVRR